MAVPEQTPYIEYTANGIAKSFALEFDCENQDHLIVLVDDVEPVVGTWSLSDGAAVFGTAPINGKKITIQRNTPVSRSTNFQSFNNSFRPDAINKDIDKVWLKLQELGVADWLLKIYVDRLHQHQEQKIDSLKNYVDLKDDELRAYLMEEIRKQGVALDQLDEYYNYLMQRLAQIAVDKGWDAAFVVDESGRSQQEKNRDQINVLDYFTNIERLSYFSNQSTYASNIPIQRALNQARGKEIDFGGLEFRISGSLILSDKVNFVLKNGSIKALGNMPNTAGKQCIEFIRCRKFSTLNFKFDGNRQQRTPVELAVHNIQMQDCHGFMFINVDSDNSICDGIYIGPTSTVTPNNVCSSGMFINCNLTNAARNNASIIVGKQFQFTNCKFIGANGISPEAGVDIESNNYGLPDLIRDIVFNNCLFAENKGWQSSIVEFDNPSGIRFNGGTIISNQGGSTGSNTGGIHIINEDTILDGVTFRDFIAKSGYAIRVSAVPKSFGKIFNCIFRNVNGDGLIQTHSVSDGAYIRGSTFENCTEGAGLSLSGRQNIVDRNNFNNSKGISISSNADIVKITNNIMDNVHPPTATGSAILGTASIETVVSGNIMTDMTGSRYIQCDGYGVVIEDNHIINTIEDLTKKAIRFDGNKAKRVQRNTFSNVNSELEILGVAPFSTKTAGNSGGVTNNRSDSFSQLAVTLPAVAVGAQSSVTASLTGAFMGMQANVSFGANLTGSQIWAEVTGSNSVTIYRRNTTSAALPELAGAAYLKLLFG